MAIGLLAIPGFWLGTLVITLPSLWWQWTPPLRYTPLADDPARNLAQMAIPALILGLGLSGGLMRLTRAQMLEVLRQDYVLTAAAKGLAEWATVTRHALKNAFIPVLTLLGLQISILVSGTVVLESIFVLPGMGRYLLEAVQYRDYPVIQALNLLFATVIVLTNLIVDVLLRLARSPGAVHLMADATLTLARPGPDLQAPVRRPAPRAGAAWVGRFVRRKPLGAIGGALVLLLLVVAVFAPWLAPYPYDVGVGADRLQGPSLAHPLGTDANGRDMLSRIIWGARVSVTVGFGAVGLSTLLAVTIGVVSAYFGGWFDLSVQRVVDIWISFPALVLLVSLIAVIGPGLWSVTFVLGILLAPGTSRVVRGAVIGIRHLPYIEAARCVGAGDARMIARHVLPNVYRAGHRAGHGAARRRRSWPSRP